MPLINVYIAFLYTSIISEYTPFSFLCQYFLTELSKKFKFFSYSKGIIVMCRKKKLKDKHKTRRNEGKKYGKQIY